ncbi:MAG: exopolysaccharide biosynthesis protein [Reyranellaceae bacterium]
MTAARLPPELDGNSARRASTILSALVERGETAPLRIGDLLDALHERAFGMAILIFVLPNTLPMPGIPYVSTLTGIPICLFALQMLLGLDRPWLPPGIARRELPQRRVRVAWRKVLPAFVRVEKYVRPRHLALTSQFAERLLALVILALAIVLALPIPAGNLLPAWAIALLSLGLMERDGRFVVAGLAMTAIAAAWLVALLLLGEQLFQWLRTLYSGLVGA